MCRSRAEQADSWFVESGWDRTDLRHGVPDQGVPRARPVTKGATISDVVFCPDLTLEVP